MHAAARPFLATGVAFVGATAIAIAPIQPANPLLAAPAVPAVSAPAFTLTAQANPIAQWVSVFTDAINNVGVLGAEALSDPAPALHQLLKNQFGYLGTAVGAGRSMVDGAVQYLSPGNPYSLPAGIETAFGQLKSGLVAEAFITLSAALVSTPIMMILGLPLAGSGLLDVPAKMAQNFADVVAAVLSLNTALPLLSSALSPITGAFDALGESLQDTVGALGKGRLAEALTAVVNIPAQLTGAVLNGYTDVQGVFHPGLLTFSADAFGGGLVQTLLVTIPRAIAVALGATPPAPVAGAASAPTAPSARVVTLTVPATENPSTAVETKQLVSESASSPADPVVAEAEPSVQSSVVTSPVQPAAIEAVPGTTDDVSAAEPEADDTEVADTGAVDPTAEVTDAEKADADNADADDARPTRTVRSPKGAQGGVRSGSRAAEGHSARARSSSDA